MWSQTKKPSHPAASVSAASSASTRGSESSPNGATKMARFAGNSAEDRERAPAGQGVHAVLERLLDLVVLAVHVPLVLRLRGVARELDRRLEGGADLGRQRQLRQHRRREAPGRLDRDREHLEPRDPVELKRLREPPPAG